jgi:2-methylisocitrate lyase-like PEP mutase family enzyme
MIDAAIRTARIARFRELHAGPGLFLIPNPWDAGSARLLASLGFPALATTSSGFAATLGRFDGQVTRDEAVAHGDAIAAATDLPVSADLENGFAIEPADVAETLRLASGTGLTGCSIEDAARDRDDPILDLELAVERIRAASEAAGTGPDRLVLTARSEGYLYGRPHLAEAISRLQAFQEAGADVLFAPGMRDIGEIRTLVAEVDRPVNVIGAPGSPTVAELAEAGVRRVSVGGGFAWAALGALVDAANELRDQGTYGFGEQGGRARDAARAAFSPPAQG